MGRFIATTGPERLPNTAVTITDPPAPFALPVPQTDPPAPFALPVPHTAARTRASWKFMSQNALWNTRQRLLRPHNPARDRIQQIEPAVRPRVGSNTSGWLD